MKKIFAVKIQLCIENNEIFKILPPKNDLYLVNKQLDDFFFEKGYFENKVWAHM